ncbi:MAG: Ribosomal small subunit methyltransferase [Bacilli bacterium]|nr:Ribosomal small subunit methyltransferase [Bacilli bacterium]
MTKLRQEHRLVNPAVTRQVVRQNGFQFKKSLGQNFLIDEEILDQIVSAANLTKETGALEIGPGIGTLTQALAEHAGTVVAVEKDARLIPLLSSTLQEYPNVKVYQGDILEMDLAALWLDSFAQLPVSVVANLPYYVTTPIIMKLLEERLKIEHIVVMVQKEVAQRMAARPGGKEYGILSIAVQYYTVPQIICTVPKTAFLPEPGVDSMVIRLTVRKEAAVDVPNQEVFFAVVRAAFGQRRKTLLNNLQSNFQVNATAFSSTKEFWISLLSDIGIDPGRRAETLSLAEFAAIAKKIPPN